MSVEQPIPTTSKIIQFLAKTGITLQIIFIKPDGDDYKTSFIDAHIDSVEHIRRTCQSFTNRRDRWDYFEYGTNMDNEQQRGVYRTIDIEDIPQKKSILKKPTEREEHISLKLMKTAKWIGFRFELGTKSVLFIKKISRNNFVLHEDKLHHIVRSGIASIFSENLIKFPDDFDLIRYGDEILIFNQLQFEELFHYHIIHEKDRKEVFDHIRNNSDYDVHDLDFFESTIINNKMMLRKFGPIKDKQIYTKTKRELTILLKIRKISTISLTSGVLKFKGTREFISFFNDNHLNSPFTKRLYTSHSKTEER